MLPKQKKVNNRADFDLILDEYDELRLAFCGDSVFVTSVVLNELGEAYGYSIEVETLIGVSENEIKRKARQILNNKVLVLNEDRCIEKEVDLKELL